MRSNLRSTIEIKFGTQLAFARVARVDFSRLSKIVNEWTEPTPVERRKFAEILQVDAGWLFAIFTIPTETNVCKSDLEQAEHSRFQGNHGEQSTTQKPTP